MCEVGLDSYKLSVEESLALDYALGILIEPDLGSALIRLKEDMDFGRLVSQYVERFSASADTASPIEDALIAPYSETWRAILVQISKIGHS